MVSTGLAVQGAGLATAHTPSLDAARVQRGASWRWPLIAAVYAVAWILLLFWSRQLWFLPAGMRLGVLWLTPSRRWGWLAGAEWLALIGLVSWSGASVLSLNFFVLDIVPWLIYAAGVMLFRGTEPDTAIQSPRQMIVLLGAGLFCAAMVSPVLATFYPAAPSGSQNSLAGAFAFLYGDYIGQLVIAPLLLLLANRDSRRRLQWPLWQDLALLILVAFLIFATLDARPELAAYVLMLGFAPLFYLGFRQGWEGAAIGASCLGILIEVFLRLDLMPVDVIVLQLSLAVVGSGALLLGAASTALRSSTETLRQRNRELGSMNDDLTRIAGELRTVSQRLVRLEEQGQRELANELEYELGQAIHALGTHISLAFRDSRDEQVVRLLESLREQVREIQDSLRRALRQLRPALLDSHGLRHALTYGPVREMLHDAGIAYEPSFYGRVEALNEDARTALYRICHALVVKATHTETVRRLALKLDAMPIGPDRAQVELSLDIEASSFAEYPIEPQLLPAIQDRVLALHGLYRAETVANGVRHIVQFEAGSA